MGVVSTPIIFKDPDSFYNLTLEDSEKGTPSLTSPNLLQTHHVNLRKSDQRETGRCRSIQPTFSNLSVEIDIPIILVHFTAGDISSCVVKYIYGESAALVAVWKGRDTYFLW